MRPPRLAIAGLAAGLLMPFAAAPATAAGTLVTDWEMNESSGTKMIDSTGHNNGTLQGFTATGAGFYRFDGVNDLATASQSFDIGTADISFTTRIRFDAAPSSSVGDYDIVRGAPAGNWKLEIVRRNSGTTAKANCHFAGTTSGTQLSAGPDLADGSWHVVKCTKTAKSISLTVDGATYTKTVTIGAINTTGKTIALGGQTTSEDQYQGDIDYVKVTVG